MRNPRRRSRTLQVESLEEKLAPSSLVPVMTQRTFNSVIRQVGLAGGTFAKTQNFAQFESRLFQISSRVPFGRAQLFPIWQTNTTIFNPAQPGSGLAMVREVQFSFVAYVQAGVASGAFVVR